MQLWLFLNCLQMLETMMEGGAMQVQPLGQAGLQRPDWQAGRLQVSSCIRKFWGIVALQLADDANTVRVGTVESFCQAAGLQYCINC